MTAVRLANIDRVVEQHGAGRPLQRGLPPAAVRWMSLLAVLASACGDDGGPVDSSMPFDGGRSDGGTPMDGAPPSDVGVLSGDRLADAVETFIGEYCDCYFADEGWSTVEQCVAYEGFGGLEAACTRMIYPMYAETLQSHFACLVPTWEALAACYESAMCSFGPCLDMYDPSLCEGDPSDSFFDAVDACIVSMFVGPPGGCPDDMTASSRVGPGAFSGTTVGRGDDHSGSCGGEASPDVAHLFRAPSAGAYVIDTFGSAFDTVLHVRGGDCTGPELACGDDAGDSYQSLAVATLAAGEEVVIVVDGFGGGTAAADLEGGDYVVNIREAGEITADRLVAALQANAREYCECHFMEDGWSTVDACREYSDFGGVGGTCVRMVYPMYEAARRSTFACYVVVDEDRAACYASVMCDPTATEDCDYAHDPNSCGDLSAFDDALGVCLDSMILGPPGTCPDDMMVSTTTGMGVFSGSTIGRGADSSGSCGGLGPDVVHRWRATTAGSYVLDTFGSAFDSVLYVRNGAVCTGVELACNNDAGPGLLSEVTVTLTAGQEVLIAVDGADTAEGGSYLVNIRPL